MDLSLLISNPQRERSARAKQLLNLATSKEEPAPAPSSKKIAIRISWAVFWALQCVSKGFVKKKEARLKDQKATQ